MTIKLLIADDEAFVRAGLREFLQDSGIQIVGEAASAADTLSLLEQTTPDVVLLNPRLARKDLALLNQIRELPNNTPVVVYSTHAAPALLAAAIGANAVGILLRDAGRDAIIRTLNAAASGKQLWTREELRRAGTASGEADIEMDVQLTPREREVLAGLVNGLTNKEIAQQLDISYETVKEHVQNILHKLVVTDRTQAAVWAVRQGLV